MRLPAFAALACVALAGCTVVSSARVNTDPRKGMFLTQSDLATPYRSLGPVQITRKGIVWFGIDFAGTDLERALNEEFTGQLREAGADGAINVRYVKTDHLLITRVLLFLIPLPSEITVTGEAVKVR